MCYYGFKNNVKNPIDVASREIWLGVKRHELGYIHG
jgi:hypothetical protein